MWDKSEVEIFDVEDVDFRTPLDHLKKLDDELSNDSSKYEDMVSLILYL